MPCRCDYMEPTAREKQSKEVAQHLVYLYTRLGQSVPVEVAKAASSLYGDVKTVDVNTANLCAILRTLQESQLNEFVYNGRIKEARDLANWWEDHQRLDAEAGRV